MKHALALKVTFHVEEEQITAVELAPHAACEWIIKGVCRTPLKKKIDSWMTHYLARKKPSHELPFNLANTTPYTKQVLAVLQTVPFGKTMTYREVAERMGQPAAARAIGMACGRNPLPLLIPCHRIVGSDGTLRGFSAAGGTTTKKLLLQHETGDE